MVRRLLFLVVILVLTFPGVPGCGNDTGSRSNVPAVPDPLGNSVPTPAGGAKGGPKAG